jgi:cytochrome oxidase Cu insertion factor (SCO1/SenC/PrrC family)/copper(I)-binding protein
MLAEPMAKPAFTLTDMDGQPYDFAAETNGQLALLFFGFTYCPDICPVHLANLAAVLRDLEAETRRRITVVFVTGDPERDTQQRLREWLGAFDPTFVGLRGTVDEVNTVLADLRLPPVIHEEPDARGNYSVGHPAQILAFTPDGYLRLVYPFGIRQADWAHDLNRLVTWQFPPPTGGAEPHGGALRGTMAYVPAPATAAGPAALYVTVYNRGSTADTLVGASTRAAATIELHRHVHDEGRMRMEQVTGAPVAARDSLSLAPGGYHLMMYDLAAPLAAGDTFTVELQFRHVGRLPVKAVVVPYAALEQVVPAGRMEH